MLDFSKIYSKKELNKYISDENIIIHYFGHFDLHRFYHSLRQESNASLQFSYYNNELKWRDFGISLTPKDAVEFVMFYYKEIKKENLTYQQALNRIYKEVEIKQVDKKRYKIPKKVSLRYRSRFRAYELKYWNQYCISEEILKKFKVYPCEVWSGNILWHRSVKDDPCFVYLWNKEKLIWKAYRPYAKEEIIKGVKVLKKFYANNVTNHIQGYEFLPEEGDLLIITKSYKDVIALYTLGYFAIAPHSESLFISEKILEELKQRFKKIVVIYDNDDTGVKKCTEFTNKYNLDYWNVPKDYLKCKDPSDLIKNYGRNELLRHLNNIV